MELENSEIVQSPSKLSTPKTSLPSPNSSKLLTPPSSADSNGKGTTKKRANFTEEQKQMLREALQENHYPDAETRQDLATKLNLTMHQIKVRFHSVEILGFFRHFIFRVKSILVNLEVLKITFLHFRGSVFC